MSILIAVGVVWFWSGRCYDPKTRKRISRVTVAASAAVWLKFAHDLMNIDKTTRL